MSGHYKRFSALVVGYWGQALWNKIAANVVLVGKAAKMKLPGILKWCMSESFVLQLSIIVAQRISVKKNHGKDEILMPNQFSSSLAEMTQKSTASNPGDTCAD